MTVQVQPITPSELSRAPAGEPSAAVATRVAAARQHQRARGVANAEADGAAIVLEPEARTLAETAADKLHLSARGFTRVLRVARSVADLAALPRCAGWMWRRRWRSGTGCRAARGKNLLFLKKKEEKDFYCFNIEDSFVLSFKKEHPFPS